MVTARRACRDCSPSLLAALSFQTNETWLSFPIFIPFPAHTLHTNQAYFANVSTTHTLAGFNRAMPFWSFLTRPQASRPLRNNWKTIQKRPRTALSCEIHVARIYKHEKDFFENFDHFTKPWSPHNCFQRIFLDMLGISFESYTFFLSSGQFLANSMHRIKRYAHFCEIFQQICTNHFDARFAWLLFL